MASSVLNKLRVELIGWRNRMVRFQAKTSIKLDKNLTTDEVEFEILKKKLVLKDNKIMVESDSFDEARVILDAFRAVINYLKYKPINSVEDNELLGILTMPPFKCVTNIKEQISEGTKFCHMYQSIYLDNDLEKKIRSI